MYVALGGKARPGRARIRGVIKGQSALFSQKCQAFFTFPTEKKLADPRFLYPSYVPHVSSLEKSPLQKSCKQYTERIKAKKKTRGRGLGKTNTVEKV